MSIFSWFGQSKAAGPAVSAEPTASVNTGGATDAAFNETAEFRPAATPEAAARGLSWEMPPEADRLGLPDGILQFENKPMASVAMENSENGMVAEVGTFGAERGNLQNSYSTMDEGMTAAESWAVQQLEWQATLNEHIDAAITPWADASESYYAKLSALDESRGAEMDRDVSDGFDLGR